MVQDEFRQKVELQIILFNHYQPLLFNQVRNKFEKFREKVQNITIFEKFDFFFQNFLRLINNHDGFIAK